MAAVAPLTARPVVPPVTVFAGADGQRAAGDVDAVVLAVIVFVGGDVAGAGVVAHVDAEQRIGCDVVVVDRVVRGAGLDTDALHVVVEVVVLDEGEVGPLIRTALVGVVDLVAGDHDPVGGLEEQDAGARYEAPV